MDSYSKLDLINHSLFNAKAMKRVWEEVMADSPPISIHKQDNVTRILSWNVQSFRDVNMKEVGNEVKDFLESHDPDIILLQESYTILNNMKGYFVAFHNNITGLLILAKDKFKGTHKTSLHILPYGNGDGWRSLLRFKTDSIDVACTHLDVSDQSENTRVEQINAALKFVDTSTLIFGDLNLVRKEDYTDKMWVKLGELPTTGWDTIQKTGWGDSLSESLSVWSGRRVDYCLKHNDNDTVYKNDTFIRTDLSDHLPRIVDVLNKIAH